MAADWTIKQSQTLPTFTYMLTYANGGQVNLAGAIVDFEMTSLTTGAPVPLTGSADVTSINGGVAFSPSAADTATVGNYACAWNVLFPNATVPESFPQTGFLWASIEPSATSALQLIVDLPSVKQHVGGWPSDHSRDFELIQLIQSITPLIEQYTGPIVPRVYDEWYDGGANLIELVHRPSGGFGTSPVISLLAASEYRGPIEYPLSIIASPAFGSIYSVFLDPTFGTLTRRTAGGRTLAFMPGRQSIHVIYQSGQSVTPPNVRFAALEAVRISREWTQQVGRGSQAPADAMEVGPMLQANLSRVMRMYLSPTRRAPSFA